MVARARDVHVMCAVCRMGPADGWAPDCAGNLLPICGECAHRWAERAHSPDCKACACPVCGEGIADGGCHAHGVLLVQRPHSPFGLRRV